MSNYQQADTYAHSPYINLSMTSNVTAIPASTLVKTPWDTVKTNENGCFDVVNKQLVCPKAGRLQLTVTFIAELPPAVGASLIAMAYDVRIDNSAGVTYNARRLAQGFGKQGFSSVTGCTVLSVNQGDRVYGMHFVDCAGSVITGSNLVGAGFEWDFSSMTLSYLH